MTLRVTVYNERTGNSQTVRVPPGEYFVVCHDPCHVAGSKHDLVTGITHVDIEGHAPSRIECEE